MSERSDIRVGITEVCEAVVDVSIMSCAAPRALLLPTRIVCDYAVDALLVFVEDSYCEMSGGSGTSGRMH